MTQKKGQASSMQGKVSSQFSDAPKVQHCSNSVMLRYCHHRIRFGQKQQVVSNVEKEKKQKKKKSKLVSTGCSLQGLTHGLAEMLNLCNTGFKVNVRKNYTCESYFSSRDDSLRDSLNTSSQTMLKYNTGGHGVCQLR